MIINAIDWVVADGADGGVVRYAVQDWVNRTGGLGDENIHSY